MNGRTGHGRAIPRASTSWPGLLPSLSQVLVAAPCPAATCVVAAPGGPHGGGGLRRDRLDPAAAPAATNRPPPAAGLPDRGRPVDRANHARGFPLGGPRRGGFPSPGPSRGVGARDHRDRGPRSLGCGAGPRSGRDSGHRTPGQLGDARGLAGRPWHAGLGDLSSVPGSSARPLRPGTPRTGRGAGDSGRRNVVGCPASPPPSRDSGDSDRPGAARRVGAVYLLRSGVPGRSGAGAAGPGHGGADRSGLSGVSAGSDAAALRGRHRPGSEPGRRRSDRGSQGNDATIGPGTGGLDP